MPPKGGKRAKRGKKFVPEETDKKTPFKEDGQDYAIITSLLGGFNIRVSILDTKTELICGIPGKFRKKMWVKKDDIILVGIRSFQQDKCDLLYKYSPEEVSKLVSYGEIPVQNTEEGETTTLEYFENGEEENDQEIDLEEL